MSRTTILAGLLLSSLVLSCGVALGAEEGSFDRSAESVRRDLEKSLRELSALREQIAAEKLPLTRELRRLEDRVVELRRESEETSRRIDNGTLDLTGLESDVEAHRAESAYLSNLLDEYVRNLEAGMHITELQRHGKLVENARLAPQDADLSSDEVFAAQTAVVEASVDRLTDLVGGTVFPGQAIGEDGRLEDVTFALVGPVALFDSAQGGAGLAEQRLGSLEPNMVPFEDPALAAEARAVVASRTGQLPFDPTLGNARKIAATRDSLLQHVEKGGPVMIPILLLAAAAFVVAVGKWFQLARVRRPSKRKVAKLLEAVKDRDYAGLPAKAAEIRGPTGEMLRAGVEFLGEAKELVEEAMFEKMLETRLRLQSFLSFVAVSAAAAPLLGLLGTVTGIINTFKLITVFGTGDAKTLSSGISEALITTEFGLIVAIPSLLLHAYLSRKARRYVDEMEKTAVSMLNRVPATSVVTESGPARSGPVEGGAEEHRPWAPAPQYASPAMARAGAESIDH